MRDELKIINSFYNNNGFIKFNKTHILFYDHELFLSLPYSSELDVVLEADPLLKLFAKFKTEIQIIQKEEYVLFTVDSVNVKLPIADIQFPELIESEIDMKKKSASDSYNFDSDMKKRNIKNDKILWKKLPDNFMEALNFASISLSTNNSDGLLTCFYIKDNVYTCDNYRLTEYFLSDKMDSFLISGIFYKRIKNNKWTHYSVTSNALYFKEGKLIIKTSIIHDDYIDIAEFLNVNGVVIKNDIETLKALVDNVGFLISSNNKSRDEFVHLEFNEDEITCISTQSNGSCAETIISKDMYVNFSFKINPHLFNAVIDKADEIIIGENTLLFSGKNFKHILCMGGV